MPNWAVFSLDNVKEYRMEGEIYEALVINSKREFYHRLVTGDVSLYKRRKTYTLKSGDQLKPINRKNFKSVIASTIKCEGSDQSLSRLTFRKTPMKRILIAANEGTCNSDLIPYRKVAVTAGYSIISTSSSPNSAHNLKKTVLAPFIGLFLDLPLAFKRPGSYFSLEVSGSSFQPSYFVERPGETSFMALRIRAINVSTGFKFIKKTGNMRPYMKFGATSSFLHIECPTGFMTTDVAGSTVNIKQDLMQPNDAIQIGVNGSLGLEIPIQKRQNIHVEVKYLKSLSDVSASVKLGISSFGVGVGYNF